REPIADVRSQRSHPVMADGRIGTQRRLDGHTPVLRLCGGTRPRQGVGASPDGVPLQGVARLSQALLPGTAAWGTLPAARVSRAAALRESIKSTFYPFAVQHGFVRGKADSMFTPFRRVRGGLTDVFDIQWDKYGRPRFVINFGEAPSAGVTFQGKLGPAHEVQPFHCPLNGRLQRWRGGSHRTWFQLRKPWPE